MKNKYILLIILFAVLALVFGYYEFRQVSAPATSELPAETSTTTQSTSTQPSGASSPSGTKETRLYTNQKYNFSLVYPATAKIDESIVMFHDLGNKWRVNAGDFFGQGITTVKLVTIDTNGIATNKPYPLFYTSQVRVGISEDTKDCYVKDMGYDNQKVTDVAINGINFKRFDFSDAAMMKYVQGVSYRTIHNNLCYAVEQVRHGSSYKDETMKPGLSQATLDAYYTAADQVLKTFKFTK